jgi:hypothetical protein
VTPAAREHARGSEREQNRGHEPSLLPAQVTELLEQVVYQQVLEHVDLDGMFQLEQQLTLIAGSLPGISPDQASHTARTLIDHALRQIPDSARNYLRIADCLSGDGDGNDDGGGNGDGGDNGDGAVAGGGNDDASSGSVIGRQPATRDNS